MTGMQDEVAAALSEVLRKHDGSMLGRYVIVAESLEADGQRSTWVHAPGGQAPWESLGLLEFGRSVEYGASAAASHDDDD